jgi:hypothetical protein
MDEKEKRTVVIRRHERRADHDPRVGAYILIGIGLFFLLANLGIISGIIRLWPLIFIAIGAYLLWGRNTAPSELHHEHFSAPKENTEAARVKLNLSVGEAVVSPVADPTLLIDADVVYLGEVKFVAQGDGEKFVSLGQTSNFTTEWLNPANWFHGDVYRDLRWNVRLNPDVPTDLDVNGGAGRSEIDLSRFNLTGLDISNGVGEMVVTLPSRADHLDARVQVGVGRLDLTIPTGAALHATVKGGVGETNITVPVDAAVQVNARSGIGSLKISSRLQKVSGNGEGINPRGTWETPNFASAERQIVIDFDGGIGELNVR